MGQQKFTRSAVASGGFQIQTCEATGAQRIVEAHGRYQDAVLAGNVYTAANPAGTAVTTQAGLSATTPALTLYNPTASGKNLVLLSASFCVTASPAAAAGIMLAYNSATAAAPTLTTPVTAINHLIGNTSVGVALAARVSTLAAAPVAFVHLGGPIGASAISGEPSFFDLAGLYIVTPGVAISFQATSAAAILASLSWEEIPV